MSLAEKMCFSYKKTRLEIGLVIEKLLKFLFFGGSPYLCIKFYGYRIEIVTLKKKLRKNSFERKEKLTMFYIDEFLKDFSFPYKEL